MKISDLHLTRSRADMDAWPEGKFLIDTVNAHSFVVAQKDGAFAKALTGADALLPDGISIVKACRWLRTKNAPAEKIAGADLFAYEMGKLERHRYQLFHHRDSWSVWIRWLFLRMCF